MPALYDTIGRDYATLRRPDPRIAAPIHAALGKARTVLNVGAGAGSYEPADREVTAVELSAEMIRQRPAGAAPAVQASAEDLPFADASFDAAMAVLTIHHWSDPRRGLAEMRRVSRGPVVLVTYDPAHRGNWLAEYLPGLVELDERAMPSLGLLEEWLGPLEVAPLLVPHDCRDCFLYAWWRRPAAYLDPRIRQGSSAFHLLDDCETGLAALDRDLASGEWERRHGDLLDRDSIDAGYRLIVARG